MYRAAHKGVGRRSTLAALVVVLLTSGVVAGCGGSSSAGDTTTDATTTSDTTTTTETTTETTAVAPTHEEFVANLDSICRRENEAVADLQEQWAEAVHAGNYAKAAALLEQLQRVAVPFRAELAELVAPTSDDTVFARFKEANNRFDGLTDRTISALKVSDVSELIRLFPLATSALEERTNAALDLGTEHCGT